MDRVEPDAKRARGWRRELELAQPVRPNVLTENRPSALATKLLMMWSAGEISSSAVQVIAHMAVLDGADHPELGLLASVGAWGSQPGNASRDIIRSFLETVNIPEADLVSTVAMDPKTSKMEQVNAAVFSPHKMFHKIESYSEFALIFCESKLEEFWNGVEASGDPRLLNHPMCQVPGWKRKFVPIFLHGDGVEFQDRDSLMVFSWGCLLSALNSQDSSILTAAYPKSATIGHRGPTPGTWDPMWDRMVWSFKAGFDGFFPAKDENKKDFAEGSYDALMAGKQLTSTGLRLALWAVEGDHEFMCNILGHPHWRSDEPCWDCDTNVKNPAKTWHELRKSKQGFCKKTYHECIQDPPRHQIFSIPGVNRRTAQRDAMHVLFSKGILSYLLGSTLHSMCWPDRGRQTVSPTDRLAIIFDEIQELYTALQPSSRLTNLKIGMFTDESRHWLETPFLNAKASECKWLLPCLAVISQQACTGSESDRRRTAALAAMSKYVNLLDVAGFFLTDQQADDALALTHEFLGHYHWLNQWALAEQRPEWHIVTKFHFFQHMSEEAKYLNPRVHWCFKSEDYVGKISKLAHSICFGVRSTHMSLKLAEKYRFMLHLRYTRGDFQD